MSGVTRPATQPVSVDAGIGRVAHLVGWHPFAYLRRDVAMQKTFWSWTRTRRRAVLLALIEAERNQDAERARAFARLLTSARTGGRTSADGRRGRSRG